MKIGNTRLVIEAMRNLKEHGMPVGEIREFAMNRFAQFIDSANPRCGTACCLAGFADGVRRERMGIGKFEVKNIGSTLFFNETDIQPAATKFLGLTTNQADILFLAYAPAGEKDPWADFASARNRQSSVLKISGMNEINIGIAALEKALEFWGEPGTEIPDAPEKAA